MTSFTHNRGTNPVTTIIILAMLLNNLIICPKQEGIMEFLTLDFKGLENGIQLKNKSNLRLLNCLKKNSKIIFYANTIGFFFVGICQIVGLLFLFLFAYVYSN